MRRIGILRISQRFSQNISQLPIKIPKKVYRDELSILKALSGTVQREFCYIQPDVNYKHEMYLSNGFLQGKIDAIKAFNENGKFFGNFAREKPLLKSIMPTKSATVLNADFDAGKITYDEYLNNLMFVETPDNIYRIYSETKAENSCSNATLLSLIELFGAADSDALYLESYTNIDTIHTRNNTNVEKSDSVERIDELFESIKDKWGELYEAVIRGKAQHSSQSGGGYDAAAQCLKAMEEAGFSVGRIDTINDLFQAKVHSRQQQRQNLREDEVIDMFEDIKRRGLSPNIDTFNIILGGIRDIELRMKLLNEASFLGLEFNLSTFMKLSKDRNPRITKFIIEQLELRAKNIDFEEITSVDDIDFFYQMMKSIYEKKLYSHAERFQNVICGGGRFHLLKIISRPRKFLLWSHFLLEGHNQIGLEKVLKMISKFYPEYVMIAADHFERVLDILLSRNLKHNPMLQEMSLDSLCLLLKMFNLCNNGINWNSDLIGKMRSILSSCGVMESDSSARSKMHSLFFSIIQQSYRVRSKFPTGLFYDPHESLQLFLEFGSDELIVGYINLLAYKQLLKISTLRDSLEYFTLHEQVASVQEILDCITQNEDMIHMKPDEKPALDAMLNLLWDTEELDIESSRGRTRKLLCDNGFDNARINEVVSVLSKKGTSIRHHKKS